MKYAIAVGLVAFVIFLAILDFYSPSGVYTTVVEAEHFVNGGYVLEIEGKYLEVYGTGTRALSVAVEPGSAVTIPKEVLKREFNVISVRNVRLP